MEYIAEPLQRKQLRNLALYIRSMLNLQNDLYFPVLPFFEYAMPRLFEGFTYEIVPKEEFPHHKHADTDIMNHCIRIREDVYYGAVRGNGRDRMTIVHEIAHYFLLVICGIKFDRAFGDAPIEAYRDPEWQAKALAGEIMCPAHLIERLTVEQISIACGVSMPAAKYNLKTCKKRGDAY